MAARADLFFEMTQNPLVKAGFVLLKLESWLQV